MNIYRAGIDIGSTTVKLVLLNQQKELVFGKYMRHGARTQEALAALLQEAKTLLGDCTLLPAITGSGSINLGKALGIPFVQEHFETIVLGIVFVSVLPAVFGAAKAALATRKAKKDASAE